MGLFGSGKNKPQQNYTKITTNDDHVLECEGCRGIVILLRRKRYYESNGTSLREPLQCRVHWSYGELDDCARNCIGCQFIRRAFLLNEIVAEEVQNYRSSTIQGEVWVQIADGEQPNILSFSLRRQGHPIKTAELALTNGFKISSLLVGKDPQSEQVVGLAREWLRTCHGNHDQCAKLSWSPKNPTNLIHIIPETDKIRLVEASNMDLVPYMALSYTWGKELARNDLELQEIDNNQTTTENKAERRRTFPRRALSKTIQDVMSLSERLGVYYLWVDAVCIPEDADWNDEGSKMHEVYGNAHVTLSICSTLRATDSLFDNREAWNYNIVPCKFNGFYLVNRVPQLNSIRRNSPLSSRAWTLQEERLSPRILYWAAHGLYWSCLTAQHSEVLEASPSRGFSAPPLQQSTSSGLELNSPQQFVSSCRSAPPSIVHKEWLDIVEDYTWRTMFRDTDRFPTLSGLAVRYATSNPVVTSKDGRPVPEQYLAGLWRSNLATDLAWMLPEARTLSSSDPKSRPLHHRAPSWSWASLPLHTAASLKHSFQEAPHFSLEEVCYLEADSSPPTYEEASTTARATSAHPDIFESIKRGAYAVALQVRGRFRPFVGASSQKVAWKDVRWTASSRNIVPDTTPRFDFRRFIDRNVHSRDSTSGMIVAYEAHREEVLGYLDYRKETPNSHETTGSWGDSNMKLSKEDAAIESALVPDGGERDLWCLEVCVGNGGGAALLLEKVRPSYQRERRSRLAPINSNLQEYRRVGCLRGYRTNYFAEAVVTQIWLV
jgi:hypothetical protein